MVENVAWIEQFAEIALAHQYCRHRQAVRIGEDIPYPFLSPVPENLALVGVEMIRNVQRTAYVVTELVVVDRRSDTRGCWDRIPLPWVGIKNGVADVFVRGTVKSL